MGFQERFSNLSSRMLQVMNTIQQFFAPFSETKNSKTVLPDPLPNGEVLQDISKKKWILGPSIGVGGFGEIYAAAEYVEGSKKLNYEFVIKIEPHGNGPLFCEMHFFVRCAKPDMIKSWCSEHNISCLGMPRYLGSGSHEHKDKKYRFLVMDRYGKDLWHIFLENNRRFPISTVYKISLQLIDVLEYIHSVGYVHADIKGANILIGFTKKTQNQVYLVDYGLVSKYTKKDYKLDPKKAHNGTIEYTSRDAHDGVPTRRGDIEILAYNMIQWMGTTLPWEKSLNNPVEVQNSKKKYMANIPDFLNNCFGKKSVPGTLKEFLNYVKSMKFDTEPNYDKLRNILSEGIKNEGGSATSLDFKMPKQSRKSETDIQSPTPEKRPKLSPKKKSDEKQTRKTRRQEETVESESEDEEPVKVSRGRANKKKQEETVESESDDEEPVKISRGRAKKKEVGIETVANGYTAEMLRLKQQIAERKAGKKGVKKSNSSGSGNGINLNHSEEDVIEGTPPENFVSKRRKNRKNEANGDSETKLTPRSLRAAKKQ